MDQRSFDRLARLLGEARDRRTGLKALAGAMGLLGAGGLAALGDDAEADARRKVKAEDGDRRRADDAESAKKTRKKRTCKPACTSGHVCQKVGKRRECVCPTGVTCGSACCALGQSCVDGQCRAAACDPPCANGYVCEGTTCTCPSGVECGNACCASGQTCENGTCAGAPDPGTCIAPGEPCKSVGRPCCEGRVCASGQGGDADVACYAPKTGRCTTTVDCVYGTVCTDGRCTPPPPAPGPAPIPVDQLGAVCNPATNVCTSPGATCTAYDGDQPIGLSGTYCTLPLGMTCTGDPECTCYRCGYPEIPFTGQARRQTRDERKLACCGPAGYACTTDRNCCEDNVCINGTCTGKACTVCASGCPYTTIAAAIAAGVTDIRVGAGTYYEHDLPSPAGSFLRIRPCGDAQVTIDAQRQGRIMRVDANKTVTFRNLTVKNGLAPTGEADEDWNGPAGGGFRVVPYGKLILEGTTVSDCWAWQGGGIAVTAARINNVWTTTGAVEITDSTITRCQARDHAKNYAWGGGIFAEGALTMTDSVVSDNVVASRGLGIEWAGYGCGGIYAIGPSANLTRVKIQRNDAGKDSRGGGMCVETAAPATLVDCEVTDNVAGTETDTVNGNVGGGFWVYNGKTLNMTGGVIARNRAYLAGGVVSWGTTNLTGVDVRENTATGGGTAGVYLQKSYSPALTCAGSTVICGNPTASPATATGATNCDQSAQGGTFTGCDTACAGGPKTAGTAGSGACAA